MKKSTSSILLIVAVACLLAPAFSATPDCTAGNPFYTWLKGEFPDAALAAANTARPTTGWEACDDTWGTDGTCCDLSKLKDSFKKIAGGVKKGWDDFMQGYKQFKDMSKKVKDAAGGANAKAKFEGMKGDAAYDLKGLSSDQAQAIVNKIDTLEADLKTFKDKADACFKASNNIRSNIFCSGCQTGTGFSNVNGADGKQALSYTFKSGTCNDAIAACVPVWSFMFNMQAQMLLAVQAKRKDNGGKGDAPKGPPTVPRGKSFGDLATFFTNCPDGKVSTTCTQDNLDNLCGIFISFKKPEPIAKPMDSTDAATAAPPARLLQAATASTDDGTGTTSASGLTLNKETKTLSSGLTIDASTTGSSTSNSGNILLVSFIAMIIAALSI